MSLSEVDAMVIARAIEDCGQRVETGDIGLPTVTTVCKAIALLGEAARIATSSALATERQLKREVFLRECAENDARNLKARSQ